MTGEGLEVVSDCPLPKFQLYVGAYPTLLLVKVTVRGPQPSVGSNVKEGLGGSTTTTVCLTESIHPSAVVTSKNTEYVPVLEYVILGDCNMEVIPFPKSQNQNAPPVLELIGL